MCIRDRLGVSFAEKLAFLKVNSLVGVAEGSIQAVDGLARNNLQRDSDNGLAFRVNNFQLVAVLVDLEKAVLKGNGLAVLGDLGTVNSLSDMIQAILKLLLLILESILGGLLLVSKG